MMALIGMMTNMMNLEFTLGLRHSIRAWRSMATGPVTLNGVSAQGNIGDGVNISAWNSIVTIKNSVFDNNDTESFVEGWGDGLWIDGNIVTLENIQANE